MKKVKIYQIAMMKNWIIFLKSNNSSVVSNISNNQKNNGKNNNNNNNSNKIFNFESEDNSTISEYIYQ
jgi:hypothetical protein